MLSRPKNFFFECLGCGRKCLKRAGEFFSQEVVKKRVVKKSQNRRKKRGIYPLGVTTQVGSSLYIFRKKKVKVLATWAFKLVPYRSNLCLNLIDCFFCLG